MALYGVGLDTTIRRLNTDFKLAISQKGGSNVRNLRRIFKSMDTNGNHKLEMKEFQAGLANFGFFPKIVDLQALVNYYDQDKVGCVNFEEFMSGLRFFNFF